MAPPAAFPSVICHGVGTLIAIISQLNTLPACAPVNASMPTPRLATHDWGHDGSVLLSCMTFSFATPRRFIPAHDMGCQEDIHTKTTVGRTELRNVIGPTIGLQMIPPRVFNKRSLLTRATRRLRGVSVNLRTGANGAEGSLAIIQGPRTMGRTSTDSLPQVIRRTAQFDALVLNEVAYPAGLEIGWHSHELAAFALTLRSSSTESFRDSRFDRTDDGLLLRHVGERHSIGDRAPSASFWN